MNHDLHAVRFLLRKCHVARSYRNLAKEYEKEYGTDSFFDDFIKGLVAADLLRVDKGGKFYHEDYFRGKSKGAALGQQLAEIADFEGAS